MSLSRSRLLSSETTLAAWTATFSTDRCFLIKRKRHQLCINSVQFDCIAPYKIFQMLMMGPNFSASKVFPSIDTVLSKQNKVSKDCFALHSLIGEGGFGKVVSAALIKSKAWYAIKCISKAELMKHKTGISMLFGELKTLERVQHPYIASAHFAFQDRRTCYLVLDLKCGGDLRYYLRKKVPFKEADVSFFVACLSSALAHIHSLGILHRDVKPENIILDTRGFPHLTDFGVAYLQTDFSRDSTLTCRLASGTKQYLAPEVFTKTHVHGPESDYWALGVVAFELLFCRRPFEKHAPHAFIHYVENCHLLAMQRKEVFAATRPSAAGHSNSSSSQYSAYMHSPTGTTLSTSQNSPNSSSQQQSPGCSSSKSVSFQSGTMGSLGQSTLQFLGMQKSLSSSSGLSQQQQQQQADKELREDCKEEEEEEGNPSRKSFQLGSPVGISMLQEHIGSPLPAGRSSQEQEETCQGSSVDNDAHWIVSHHELPPSLKAMIPSYSPVFGPVSDACIDMLDGFLDVRPPRRLGHKPLQTRFHQHPFFAENGIDDFACIENKTFRPPFVPIAGIFEDISSDISSLIDEMEQESGSSLFGLGSATGGITSEQNNLFTDYYYIHPQHAHLFEVSPANVANNHNNSNTCSGHSNGNSSAHCTTNDCMEESSTGGQHGSVSSPTPSHSSVLIQARGQGSGQGPARTAKRSSPSTGVVSSFLSFRSSASQIKRSPSSPAHSSSGKSNKSLSISSNSSQSTSQLIGCNNNGNGNGIGSSNAKLPTLRPASQQRSLAELPTQYRGNNSSSNSSRRLFQLPKFA